MDPKRKDRGRLLDSAVVKADSDPVIKLAAKQTFKYSKQEAQVRDELLSANLIGKLKPEFVHQLLNAQGYHYRNYVSTNQRKESANYYGRLAKRQPKDISAATTVARVGHRLCITGNRGGSGVAPTELPRSGHECRFVATPDDRG